MSLNAAGPKKGGTALGSSGVPIGEYSRKEDQRPAYMQSRPTISGVPLSAPFPTTDAATSGGAANNPNDRKAAAANSASAAPVGGAVGSGQTTQQQQSSSTPLLPATSSTLLQLGAFAVSDGRRVLTPSGLPYNHRHKFYYVKESNMAPLTTSVIPPAILPAALLGGGAGNISNAAQSNSQQVPQARRVSAAVGGATPLVGIASPLTEDSVHSITKSDAAISLPFRAQTPNFRLSSSSSSLPISHQIASAAAVPVRPNSASVGMVMPAGPMAPYVPLANPHQSVLASGLVYESVLRPLTSGGGAVYAGTGGANSRCGSSTPPVAFSFFHNTTMMAADSSDILSGSSSPYKGTPGKPPRPAASSALSPLHPHTFAYGGGVNSPLSSTLTGQKGQIGLPSLLGHNVGQQNSNRRPPSSTSRIRACGLPRGPVEVEQQDSNQHFNASYTQKKGSADDYAEFTGSSPPFIGGKRSTTPSSCPQLPTVAVVESASAHAILSGEDILNALESDAGAYAATLLTDLPIIPSETRLRPSRSEVAAYLEAMSTWWGTSRSSASQSLEDDGRSQFGGNEVDLLSDAYRLRFESRTEEEMSSAGADPVGAGLRERQQRKMTAPAGSDNPYLDFADQPLSSVSLSVVGVDLETVFGRSYTAQRCLEEQLMLEARTITSSSNEEALTAVTSKNKKNNKNFGEDHAVVSSRRGKGGARYGMAGIARDDEADDMFPLPPPSSKGVVNGERDAPVSLGRQHRLTAAEKQQQGQDQEEKLATTSGGATLAPTRTPTPTTMTTMAETTRQNNSEASLSPAASQPTTARPSDKNNCSDQTFSPTSKRKGGDSHTTRQRNGIVEIASLIRAAMLLKEKVEEIDGGGASNIADYRGRGGKKSTGSRKPAARQNNSPDATTTSTSASVFLSTLSKALTSSHQRLFGHHVALNVNVDDNDKKNTVVAAAAGDEPGRSPPPSRGLSSAALTTKCPYSIKTCVDTDTFALQVRVISELGVVIGCHLFMLPLTEKAESTGEPLSVASLTSKLAGIINGAVVSAIDDEEYIMAMNEYIAATTNPKSSSSSYYSAGLMNDERTGDYSSYTSGKSKIPQKTQNIAIGVVEIPIPHGQQQQQQKQQQDDTKEKTALSPSRKTGHGNGATKLFVLPQPLQDPSPTAANTRRNHAALCLMTNSVSSSALTDKAPANSNSNHKNLPTHEDFIARVSEPNMNNSQLLKKLTSVAFVVSVDVHLVLSESEAATASSMSSSLFASTNNTVETLGPVEGTIMTNAGLTILAHLNLTREAVRKACRTKTPKDTFDRLELADEGDGSLIANTTSTKSLAKKSTNTTGKREKARGNASALKNGADGDENAIAAEKEHQHGDSAQKTPVPTVVIESRLLSALVRSHAPLIGSSALSRAVLVLAAMAQQEYDAAFGAHLQEGFDADELQLLSTHAKSLRRLSSYAFGASGVPGSGLTGGTQIKGVGTSSATFDVEAARSNNNLSANGSRSFNTVGRSGEFTASTVMASGGGGIECIVRSPVPRDGLRTALQQAAAGIAARDEELTEAYILSQGGTDSFLNPPSSGPDPSFAVSASPPTAGKGAGKQQSQQRAGPGAQSTIGTAAKRMSLAASMMTGPNNNGLGGSRGGASTAGAGSDSGVGGGLLGGGNNGAIGGGFSALLLLAVGQGKIPDAVGVSNVVNAIDAAAVVATPAKRKSVSPASKQQGGGKRQSSTDITAAGMAAATAGGPNGVIAGVPNNILLAPDGQVLVATVPINVANYRDQQRIRHATDIALLQRREELIAAGIIQTVVEEPVMPTKPGRRGSRAPSTAGASGGPNSNARGGGGRSASPSSSFLNRGGDGHGNGDNPSALSPSAAERSRILSSGSSALVAKLYAQQLKSGGAAPPSSDVLALSSVVSSPASNALNENTNKATDSEYSVSFWMTRSDVSEIQDDALRSSAAARSWEATTIELALPDPLLLPIAVAAAYQDGSRRATAMMNSHEGSSKGNTNVLQPVMHYRLRAEDGVEFIDAPFPRPADVFALANNSLDVFLRARLMPSGTKTRQTNKAALHQALFATRSTARALIAFAGAPLKWSSDEAAQFVAAEYREEKGDTNSPLQGRPAHSRRAVTPSKMSQREQSTSGLSPSASSSLSTFSSPLVKKAVTYAPCSHTSLVSAARIYLNDLFQLYYQSENCSVHRSSSRSPSTNRHPLLGVADVMFTYGGTYRPQGGDGRTLFATATPPSSLETSAQLLSQKDACMFVAPAPQEPEPLITHIIETVPLKQTRASVSLQVRATATAHGSAATGLVTRTHNGSTIAGRGVDTTELIMANATSTNQQYSQEAVSLQPFAMSSSDARGGRFVRATFVAHPSENISVFAAEVSAMANDLVRTLMY